MVRNLQAKLEKYEAKAAQCEQSAQTASDEHRRAFYQELARYYGRLAADFRDVIARRSAPLAAE